MHPYHLSFCAGRKVTEPVPRSEVSKVPSLKSPTGSMWLQNHQVWYVLYMGMMVIKICIYVYHMSVRVGRKHLQWTDFLELAHWHWSKHPRRNTIFEYSTPSHNLKLNNIWSVRVVQKIMLNSSRRVKPSQLTNVSLVWGGLPKSFRHKPVCPSTLWPRVWFATAFVWTHGA